MDGEGPHAGAGNDLHVQGLASSSVKVRLDVLNRLLQDFEDADRDTDIPALLYPLLLTYPRYQDRHSRQAVRRCISSSLRHPRHSSEAFQTITAFLAEESRKVVIAPTNAFVLLEWNTILLRAISDGRENTKASEPEGVCLSAALCLEKCLAVDVRTSLRYAARAVAKRGLRTILGSAAANAASTVAILAAMTTGSTVAAGNAPYIGLIGEVCAQNDDLKPQMKSAVSTVLEFYTKYILGSKTAVPLHIADGLHDVFYHFVSAEDLNCDVLPFLEKAILRSPEIVLQGQIPALVSSLAPSIDLTEAVHGRLLQPILSAFRSTNINIRDGARRALEALLQRCQQSQISTKIAEDMISSLKSAKGTSTDFRALAADGISALLPDKSYSPSVVKTVTSIAIKEPNEAALRSQVSAICHHLPLSLATPAALDKATFDSLLKACAEKRIPFRKAWLLGIGSALQQLENVPDGTDAKTFTESCLGLVINTFDDIVANTGPAIQSGLAPAGYLAPTLAHHHVLETVAPLSKRANDITETSLSTKPRLSFLLNPRVFVKAASVEDSQWAFSALTSVVPDLSKSEDEARANWAQAVIYMLTSPEVSSTSRKASGLKLAEAYLTDPSTVGRSMVLGIWQWLRAIASSEKESAAVLSRSQPQQLRTCIRFVSPPKRIWEAARLGFPSELLKSQAATMNVLCRNALIPGVDWIELCLRMGIDPGKTANANETQMLEEIMSQFESSPEHRWLAAEEASREAAGTLSFVAPESLMPAVVRAVIDDLKSDQFTGIGPTEIAIAQTPPDTVFVDVLSQKTNSVENKNIKDYDVLKWEEELRSQLTQKKGPQKKLTAEQQAKVDAQLARETSIRYRIHEIGRNVRRGAALVQGLAEGPPTDATTWLSPAVTALLDAIQSGAALLESEGLFNAYLACASQVSGRLGLLRQSIGVATLRAMGNISMPTGFDTENLGELVTRVLYRLRFAAEQRPFDSASLAYMLPLCFRVLQAGAVGYPPGEDADAQVLLAIEFLGYHMAAFSHGTMPRSAMLIHLLSALRQYTQHYRILKDALLDFCRCIAPSIKTEERDILLETLSAPEVGIRSAVLQALHTELDLSDMDSSEFIWLACHDLDEDNAETALAIWEESDMVVTTAMIEKLPGFLNLADRPMRSSAGQAVSEAIVASPETFEHVLQVLQTTYQKEAQPPVPQRDKYGLIQKTDLRDHWERRSGLAIAFKALSPAFPDTSIVPFMKTMINDGPLYDRHSTVRKEMLDAGTHLVATRGAECLEALMRLFEDVLDSATQDTQESDWLNGAVIVLYGSVAQHLPPGDARIQTVISKLIATLSTPSESVQFAVAECLVPLLRNNEAEAGPNISRLLEQLTTAKQYATRRGAAYGLAGVILGRGISVLRQYRIMSSLRGATENKKSMEHRQGALFAYEIMSMLLGRTFEPYVIEVLPQLLACFGDPSAPVRDACLDTAKGCFATLSSFGVHQVLPQLLEGLNETQWRSKKGACELLGAMAYLDSQQLANSLPDIIPPLTAVLNDSHKEVRAAATNSLQRFGDVISNPEVKSLVSVLLKALSDPTRYTEDALDGLIKVSFVHYLDAPSLALVVRILERGLADRSSTKRKSAQIIGSLAHLTERRDLAIHLPILVSGLRQASVDPVPATRATASKALGSLVEKLGEDALPDLIPNLMSSLRADTGAGDRLGSAQALSEVLAGLGTSRLEETLPTILQNVSSTRAAVREGFMTLFIFLPACFGNSFANYLSQIIPSILGGLADDVEAIRDISLRAGRLLVKNFASKAIDLLLPELQRGLADDSHRIRLSSVELVGDLLFSLTGIAQKTDAEEEEEETATKAGQSLLEVLGEERRDRVLSSLYICRCDTSGLVRSAAIAVWKALVATPRTLREIAPTLTDMIINRLGSSNMEHKVIAGNALGEVIRKAGEGVFAALLPSLQEGLETSTDAEYRQGICMALREIIGAAQPESLEVNEKRLIMIVRMALVDSDHEVREAAAESFDALQGIFGKRAVDQVLPHLLSLLRDEVEAVNALSALLTLLTDATRANVILPNLIPTLLRNPISAFNAKALASLARVGGSSMNRRLPVILNTLADNVVSCKDSETLSELDAAFDAVLQSVDEYDGLNTAMNVMLTMLKHEDHRKRALAATHLASFFSKATVDYSRYNQDLIRALLISYDDRAKEAVSAAHQALTQLQARLRKEEMESLVVSTRQILQQVGVAGSGLPGFALPKGMLPVLQIFLQGLINGTAEQRVQAALGVSDIIDRSSADSLKPFVTQITGPLIRVVGERSTDVKSAILFTLNQLLERIPTFLRPFLPQLQRTFTKSIADPSSDVLRQRATKALSTLITLTPRIDPLIAELVTGAKTPDPGVRNAMLKALQEAVSKVGQNMSETSRQSILGLIDSQDDNQDESMMITNARLLGAMIKVLPQAAAAGLIKSRVVNQPPTNASIVTLNAVLLESPGTLTGAYLLETKAVLVHGIRSKNSFVQHNSILGAGKLLLAPSTPVDEDRAQAIFDALASTIPPGGDIDTRRLGLVMLRAVSREHPDTVQPHLPQLAPPVFACVRDPVLPVKLAAEAAFLELFHVVESDSAVFDEYMSSPAGKALAPGPQRQMSEYFKRVALRLGGQARERKEAEGGGDGLGLASDEVEDMREIMAVGKVEMGNGIFAQE